MEVLKVELKGVTTSFRYPHFLVGRQPSLPLPPPATIYGHISSALGEWPDPASLEFSYSFVCIGSSEDFESRHMLEVANQKSEFNGHPKNLKGKINPADRQILLYPQLTLYIKAENLNLYYKAFKQPKYAVVLGRSQDLATYTSIEKIELEEHTSGYFEGTILPTIYRNRTNAGILTQMPRFIQPNNRRDVSWEMYLIVEGVLYTNSNSNPLKRANEVWVSSEQSRFWVDPTSPTRRTSQKRIVEWQSFIPKS